MTDSAQSRTSVAATTSTTMSHYRVHQHVYRPPHSVLSLSSPEPLSRIQRSPPQVSPQIWNNISSISGDCDCRFDVDNQSEESSEEGKWPTMS